MRTLCFFLLIVLSCCIYKPGNAQLKVSDSLYSALPDSLKPGQNKILTNEKLLKIIGNPALGNLQRKYYAELKDGVSKLDQQMNSVSGDEFVPYASAIGRFYILNFQGETAKLYFRKIAEKGLNSQNYYANVCNALVNLAIHYSIDARQDSAIYFLHQEQTIARQQHDSDMLVTGYLGYVDIYKRLLLFDKAISYTDSSLHWILESEKWNRRYSRNIQDKISIYTVWFSLSGENRYADSTVHYADLFMKNKKGIPEYYPAYGECFYYKGLTAFRKKDYASALNFFDSSLNPLYSSAALKDSIRRATQLFYHAAAMLKTGDKRGKAILDTLYIPHGLFLKKSYYDFMYQNEEEKGNYSLALAYHKQYMAFNDSVNVLGLRGKVFESEQKYAVAQKEASIAQLQSKNLQAQNTKNLVIFIATIILLLTAVFIYQRGKRQRALRRAERRQLANELHQIEQEHQLALLKQEEEKETEMINQRQQISRNMHDEVNSTLAALRFTITEARRNAVNDETKAALALVEKEAREAYVQSRDFMHRLHATQQSKKYDAGDLLDSLGFRFGAGGLLNIKVDYDRAQTTNLFTPRQHEEAYCIIKEAVANTMKHSNASELCISIKRQAQRFVFNINDNGKVTSPESLTVGLGLQTMQQRIKYLQGQVQFINTGNGVSLAGWFPFAQDK